MRPDFRFIERQQRQIAEFVGETATWRKFVGEVGGNPAYGIAAEMAYQSRTVTALLKPAAFEDVVAAGGVYQAGDMLATLIDCQPGSRDTIVYQGVAYKVASDTWRQPIANRQAWRMVLRRGDAIG